MKVLFCGLKHEYGRPEWGLSTIEYQNFFGTLRQMPEVKAEMFAVDEMMAQVGREEMNKRLISTIAEQQPDLLFCFLFGEELKKETIDYITKKTKTKTFNWFADDHWRFWNYSRHWAPLFTLVSTTDSKALANYHVRGINNVVKTQWAANINLFKPVSNYNNYNITFVGKKFGNREKYIKFLQEYSFPAEGFGKGWPSEIVDFQKMLEIYSGSKINLNFSETHYAGFSAKIKLFAKLFVQKEQGKYRFVGHHLADNLRSAWGTGYKTIKARVFEIPASRGFLLTEKSDENLAEYYLPGKEIAIFEDKNDLVEKCRYYLSHEAERQAIAKAGYERTIKDHTYIQRFEKIFKFLELK